MATDFLEAAGTDGFVVTPFDLLTTELSSLADANSAISSVGGSSGVFAQSDYGSAPWCYIWLRLGGSFTPTSGSPDILGWFLSSPDGGTSFEASTAATDMPRSPDFIIPLNGANAYSSGATLQASGLVRVPFTSHRVFVMNHSGNTLPSSNSSIVAGPVTIQY